MTVFCEIFHWSKKYIEIFHVCRKYFMKTCMSHSDNFKFKCCNLIFVKADNLTYHIYQYLIMMTILNVRMMMILKTVVMTRLTTALMTVILMRTVVNIILMIKAVLVLLTWMMMRNNWYMTGLMSHDSGEWQ